LIGIPTQLRKYDAAQFASSTRNSEMVSGEPANAIATNDKIRRVGPNADWNRKLLKAHSAL
jgi:hypothetical protein